METVNNSQNFLETTPIKKLMLKFSVPCVISLLVSSLYNMVDQVFIGWGVGYLGNGATTVVYPITVIALAFALMFGDGCASYLSICRGKKDDADAKKAVANTAVVAILISLVFVVIFVVFRDTILKLFGATDANFEYAIEYFNIIIIGIPFFLFGTAMNGIIRADGSPQFALISTLTGCIINLILDPIAIFGLNWGMFGAALATIIGQVATAILSVWYLFHMKSVKIQRSDFNLNTKTIRNVFTLGISSFLTQLSIVVIMTIMNNVLVKYGAKSEYGSDIPLTVMGLVMKMFSIVVACVAGTAAGCQPIVGYNFGAGRKDRVKEIYKRMMTVEIIIGIVATICFEAFPLPIIHIFGDGNGELYDNFASLAFRLYLSTILLCSIQKASCIFLQAMGKPLQSTILSLSRDFLLLSVLALTLPIKFGLIGALYAAPIADVVCFVLAIVITTRVFKKSLSYNNI